MRLHYHTTRRPSCGDYRKAVWLEEFLVWDDGVTPIGRAWHFGEDTCRWSFDTWWFVADV